MPSLRSPLGFCCECDSLTCINLGVWFGAAFKNYFVAWDEFTAGYTDKLAVASTLNLLPIAVLIVHWALGPLSGFFFVRFWGV